MNQSCVAEAVPIKIEKCISMLNKIKRYILCTHFCSRRSLSHLHWGPTYFPVISPELHPTS